MFTEVKDSDLLGEVVTWDMGSAEVTYFQVKQALINAGLDPEDAKDLRATTCFSRAIKELKKGRVIEKLERNGDVLTFQFSQKHLDEYSKVMEYPYEAKVTLDLASGSIDCPESREIEQHARTMFAHAQGHRVTSDITRLVQNMFAKHADLYALNSKGCAYFTPAVHREFSAKVERFMDELGGKLRRYPVPKGTPEGNRSVKEAIEVGLGEMLDELRLAVDAWETNTRNDTMLRAVDRWKQISHKVEAYGEYLEDRQSTLLGALQAAKAEMVAKTQQIENEKAKAA